MMYLKSLAAKGADIIALPSSAGAAQTLVYNNINEGGDTVTVFTVAEDKIQISGALKAALSGDAAKVDGVLATPAAYAIETAAIGVVDATNNGTLTSANLTTAGYAAVATSISNAFTFTDAGSDTANIEIFAVESDAAGTFGLYAWTQSSATDTTVDGSELTLLGVYTTDSAAATITTTELTIV